eukprot:XP_003978998.2 PREDICTED: solute carrier family 22 member 13-like [Takifugu rubripes]
MSSFKQALKEAGEFGLFQKCLLAALCIPTLLITLNIIGQVFTDLWYPHHCNTDWILELAPNLTKEKQRNLTLPLSKDGQFESCKMFTPVDWDLETIEAYGITNTTECVNGWDYDAPKGAVSVMTELEMETQLKRDNLLDLFKTSYLRKLTFIFGFTWFSVNLVFYELTLNVGDFGSNIYITQIFFGAIELPSFICSYITNQHLGRKKTILGYLVLGSIACLLILAIPADLPVMVTVLGVLGKFFIAGAYNTCYIFTTESYPTSLRQNGLGLALTCACVGGIIAPLVRLLEVYHFSLPRVIFGIFPILAGCLCLLLPETKNKELQDHIDPKKPEDGATKL